MKIFKFNESLSREEINDLLIDLKDSGYEVNLDVYGGFFIIQGKVCDANRIQFLKDIIELNDRMVSIGYEYINDSMWIGMTRENGYTYCNFTLKFKDDSVSINKDVKGFEEFKEYAEKVLDIAFYEWDTEAYIPDNDSQRPCLQLDIHKTGTENGNIPPGFTIGFKRGSLSDFISVHKKSLSQLVMTDDEYWSVNLWAVPEHEKEKYQNEELIKRAKSKQFSFNKRGIEALEKCVQILKTYNNT